MKRIKVSGRAGMAVTIFLCVAVAVVLFNALPAAAGTPVKAQPQVAPSKAQTEVSVAKPEPDVTPSAVSKLHSYADCFKEYKTSAKPAGITCGTGATFRGSASVFSSAGSLEVSTMAVAEERTFLTPFNWISVSKSVLATLTALMMISRVLSDRPATTCNGGSTLESLVSMMSLSSR